MPAVSLAPARVAVGLLRLIDARDTETASHSRKVGRLAARLGARLGFDDDEVELLRLAGSLHDLGKLAIPREILDKPGPLETSERRLLETHSEIGYGMLRPLDVDLIASWVLHHHERWDGDGYPAGLTAEEIPVGSRILLVADAYDAMTSDRSYRDRLTHKEAIAELGRCAGTQFDPDVVVALKQELGVAL